MTALQPPPDDDLVFLEETPSDAASSWSKSPLVWRVMIIDDDEDVHTATVFALGNLEIQRRSLEFLHAYSATEARKMLVHERDLAVILLDVVMEQEDAGLQLIHFIRETLEISEARIILRTGQPGYAPEIDAIRDYDINDYKTKSELTRIKLFTTVTAAIRAYEQICSINASRRGLDAIVRASTALMSRHGLQDFANGIIAQIAALLNLSPDGLLVVQPSADDKELIVIAAAGRYADAINRSIAEIRDEQVSHALAHVLSQRANTYGTNYACLYFAGNSGRKFAAFLHTGVELSELDRSLVEVFCSNISVGLDNVQLVTKLHNFAFTDTLTQLPNRTRLIELLNVMLHDKASQHMTLALVDIDHFAETNAALGHKFGDLLLLAIVMRLRANLEGELTLARVSGDTFALLGHESQVNPKNILLQFEQAFKIDGQEVQLSSTVGLLRLDEHEGNGTDALKDADIALKRAKLQQRAGYFYFSRSMGVDIRERVRMMHAMRAAFDAGQLFVVYQPQIEMATGKTIGAEALLRWQTPDGNFIPPDRFIPIAEYSGFIIELGEWVMREACNELVRLRTLGYEHFMMSINVSQRQFRHPHFLDMLNRSLHDTGAPTHSVELEITESMAMEEPDLLISILSHIKGAGLRIAIDDFGTGFSSLSYLQRLNVDKLKIDRAFVTEITQSSRGSSIAEMVIQLGRNLGLQVIAEGVEDERQAQILCDLGCELAQGYLFARPMSPDQLTDWLQINGKS